MEKDDDKGLISLKKWILITLCVFLVACSDNSYTADSPEAALQLLHSKEDYAKVVNMLDSIQISEKQIFYIFEGELNNQIEWYVANIEKDEELKWFVKEAINIGLPNSDSEKYSSGTNTFSAGIGFDTEEVKDNWKIVEITDESYYVWIELEKN